MYPGNSYIIVCTLFSASTSSDMGSFALTVAEKRDDGATLRIFNDSSSSREPSIQWIVTRRN